MTLGKGTTFYTGSLTGQRIFVGDLRTGRGSVLVPGQPGHPRTGLYVDDRKRLWVVGGPAGDLRVYDASTGAALASYSLTGPAGFVSDIVVTNDAAYVNDSFHEHRQALHGRPRHGRGECAQLIAVVRLESDM